MPDSVASAGPGKRERLIESARRLIHQQGVHRTTLAEVAEHADVPLGNVYYYFKTKDDLVGAVLDGYQDQAAQLIESLERHHRSPRARLKALVRTWADRRDEIARHGCPMGTLCSELDKLGGGADREAAAVVARIIDWAEEQFGQLGRRDARDLAVALFAGIQGAALLANTFRDPRILTRQTRHLERWLDGL